MKRAHFAFRWAHEERAARSYFPYVEQHSDEAARWGALGRARCDEAHVYIHHNGALFRFDRQ